MHILKAIWGKSGGRGYSDSLIRQSRWMALYWLMLIIAFGWLFSAHETLYAFDPLLAPSLTDFAASQPQAYAWLQGAARTLGLLGPVGLGVFLYIRNVLIARRSRARYIRVQTFWRELGMTLVYWLGVAILHTWAMVEFESMHIFDAIWLTITTSNTVGYGDLSAATVVGRLATTVLIYGAGIALMGKFIGDVVAIQSTYITETREGRRVRKMEKHLVIFHAGTGGFVDYMEGLIGELRQDPRFAEMPVLLVTDTFDELPAELGTIGVELCNVNPDTDAALDKAQVDKAAHIVILARDSFNAESDSSTKSILGLLNERGIKADVAEAVKDENRKRMRNNGARQVITASRRQFRMMALALIAPGGEVLAENFIGRDGHHLHRLDLPNAYTGSWGTLFDALEENFGHATAYVDPGKEHHGSEMVVQYPKRSQAVTASAVFVVCPPEVSFDADAARRAVNAI